MVEASFRVGIDQEMAFLHDYKRNFDLERSNENIEILPGNGGGPPKL